jgi:hypothetical protein
MIGNATFPEWWDGLVERKTEYELAKERYALGKMREKRYPRGKFGLVDYDAERFKLESDWKSFVGLDS